ncbi:alpha/beta fold hydrolase [Microbacterium sp.]|uniref:alpha/beta fold hydrolase n=1 Tax=Microbacterium sp. TaxID=51671 RepID=UPI0028110055|nr:alpha/beta hydrolase [Microbacterium sp.]
MSTQVSEDLDERARFRRLRREVFQMRGFHAEERAIVDAEGRSTAVLHVGTGTATLLIHGGVGVTAEWAPLAGRLSGRVLIPDRPGFGLSDPRDLRARGFRRDSADWVAGLLDGLGLDRVELVAGSMGGFVAIAFATAHPHRVQRLVLAGAAGGLFPDPGLFLRLWATPGIGAAVSRMMPRDTESVRRKAFGGYLAHPERVPDDILEVALAAMRMPGWAAANREILREVTTLRGWRPEMRLDDDLVGSGVRTAFVVGEGDALMTVASARALGERMPQAEVYVIEDAGHIPHLDQPEAVAAAIEAGRD